EVDGAYDIYLNLFTTGITVNSSGIQDGAGTIITVELLSDVNDGLSTGTYSFDSPTEAFTISNFGYCLDWTANSSSNTWSYLDKTKGGYLKIKRTGSNYEVDFKGVDDEGNSVKGNFSGTMTMYNFLSAK
ncbi:MAG TPA: hypothetical protein PKH02_12080, partial [Bacteroidales bacterium]|nr:hypothetical protein [Bacteroidales bacterium]